MTEPVRPEYLERCKRLYRPPHFNGQRTDRKHRQQRATHAKLWIVNLSEDSLPEREMERYRQGEAKAEKLVKDTARSSTDSFHWPYKPRMATGLKFGDWIITAMRRKDKSIAVYPPGQFLLMDSYVQDPNSRKERYVFHLEVPRRGETMTWERFRRAT